MTVRFLSFPVLHSSLVSLSKNAAPPQGRAQKTSGGRHSGFPRRGLSRFAGAKVRRFYEPCKSFRKKVAKYFSRGIASRANILYITAPSQPPRGEALHPGLRLFGGGAMLSRIGTLHLAKIANVHLAKITNAHLAKRTATRPTLTVSVQSFLRFPLAHRHKLLPLPSEQHKLTNTTNFHQE